MTRQLAARAQAFPDSPMRKLTPFAEAAEQQGKVVHRLNIGQPDLPTPEAMRRAVVDNPESVFAYTRSEGNLPALEAFQAYYRSHGWELSQDQIITTTGGSEALFFTFLTLCDVGDEVLVPEPCYPSYLTFCSMTGVKPVPLTLKVEEGYRLPSREEIEARITPRTRAILFTNPSNPTGAVLSREELQRLADVAREHDLFLVADEVYREFVFDGVETCGALDLEGMEDRVIVCDSVSKRWSACGIRIGCLVSRNQDFLQTAVRLARARLSAPYLGQVAVSGIPKIPESYMEETVAEYRRRRDTVLEALEGVPGLTVPRPRGAFYTMLRLPVDSAERFARWLLTDFELDGETLMVSPGPGFYLTEGAGIDEVRLAFMVDCERLQRAARCLVHALDTYPHRT